MEFNNILFDKDNQTGLIELNRPKGCSVFKGEKGGINKIALADRAFVIENGSIVLAGEGKDLLGENHVKEAYLGL